MDRAQNLNLSLCHVNQYCLIEGGIEVLFIYADFQMKSRLRMITKNLYQTLIITDFYDMPGKYLKKINMMILRANPFITKLRTKNNKITDINFLTRLTMLSSTGRTRGICNKDIDQLNLKYLSVNNNPNIWNIGHMNNLEILHAEGYSSIGDHDIQALNNLKELYIDHNKRITDVNHLTKLEVLSVRSSFIKDLGIQICTLKKLYIDGSMSITNLNHMTNLEVLSAKYCHSIRESGIKSLKLKELYLDGNKSISNVNFMTTLEKLSANYISDVRMLNLKELCIDDINVVPDLNHMTNLQILRVNNYRGSYLAQIDNYCLATLNLSELYICHNTTITKIAHLTNLKVLDVIGNCSISKEEVAKLNLTTAIGNFK